jgi:hypothetical protein
LVDPPKIVRNAFYAPNVILSIVSIFKMQFSTRTTAKALKEYGVRLAYIGPNTAEELASEWACFPAELSFAIAQKTKMQLQSQGGQVTLTDEKGTHLEITVERENWTVGGFQGPLNKPGRFAVLPIGTVGTNRIKEVNGNIYLDFLESFGPTGEICQWVVKDNWVRDIKGGDQARAYKEKIFKVKNANLFSQITWGFNPKENISKALQPPWNKNKLGMLTRFAGVMHLGLGATLFHQKGDKKLASAIHTHGILLNPTLTAGKNTIIEKGRLSALDDPDLRELAKKYGDPDKVLAQFS